MVLSGILLFQTTYITQRVTQLNLPPPLGRTALPLLDAVLKTKEEYIMQKRAARRGTRALAFLLCLLMVVSLLPVMGASAAEGDVTAEGVKLNKSLTLESDGTYTITLEAYATGTVTSTTLQEPVPTDFVLVLDQSGSMADNIYTAADRKGYTYNDFGSNTELYYKDGDSYYKVSSSNNNNKYYLRYTKDNETYYLSNTGSTTKRNNASSANSQTGTIWTGVLYTRSSQTKLAALKTAVENFVTSVQNQKDLNGLPVAHRIAIVGFAQKGDGSKWGWEDNLNSELFIGSDQYNYSSTDINNQYENALQQVTTTAGINNLKDSINALGAEGGTYPQLGFEMANNIFQAYRDKNDYQYTKVNGDKADRGTVVVMFTDGEPGAGGTVDATTANATMQAAKTSKNTYNAKVFTIGVFSSSNSNLDDINTYMNAVSSNYQPNANQTPTMDNLGDEKPASDLTNYYAMADDSEALNNAFQSVSSSINSSSTSCELDAESVLKDVISGNLDLPDGFTAKDNVTVSTATCTGADANDNPIFGNDSPFSANVSIDSKTKTVNVSDFDYSSNYVTTGAENKGKKLIVTITGLLPNQDGTGMPSNEATSGIYNNDAIVAQFEVPTFNVASRNVVLDFSMTANIANVTGVQGNKCVSTSTYGEFTYGSNDLTYNLNKSVASGNLVFDGIDSALYYGHAYGDNTAQNAWTKVNVIPANNVYFDDDLLTEQSTFTDGDYGYDAAVNNAADDVEQVADNTRREFTFTGTGIDVYCTTESTSGWISAVLLNTDGSRATDADGNNIKAIYMNNQYVSEPNLINVPTISIQNVPYGKYVLRIETMNSTNYKLDGVRIYNPANDDAKNVAAESGVDVNAQFVNVRDTLLSATPKELTQGAVYVDENHATGDISVYEKVGPKNEVYLAQGQKVGFQLTGVPAGAKVLVGLSVPENQGSATAKVTYGSNAVTTLPVNSAIDMYYPVTVGDNGYVVIENTGNVLLSVTNVQISGGDSASNAILMSSPELMSYMAEFDSLEVVQPEPEPTPDPEPTVNNNTVSAIIHAIWTQVMDGIGKLFGRL